jgi:hypothetical protein
MQGRLEAGAAWLQARERDWAPDNFFAIHNYWHLALFQLEAGDVALALALYDQRVRASQSEVNVDLVDASALLWRLALAGADVRERFTALAEVWRRVDEHGYYGFNDWHALMAYAGAGQSDEVARVIRGLEAREEPRAPGHAETLAACRGFAAFAAQDHARAVDELFAMRAVAARFGGSHAQRDVIELTLVEAALRAGQRGLARALCEARRARKPDSPGTLNLLARATSLSHTSS